MIKIKTINDYESLIFEKHYAFRGECSDSFDLLPGTYRDKNDYYCGPKIEIICLFDFLQQLRQDGFKDSIAGVQETNIFTRHFQIFPEEDLLPYMALAQHYAYDSSKSWFKTSLLDITYCLDIATYFAVREGMNNSKIYVFDTLKIKEKQPYKIYSPVVNDKLMARMAVQSGALLYREQNYEGGGDIYKYQNIEVFNDIVYEEIIIPSSLKANLKEYLHRKLFDFILFPRLVLGQKIPDMSCFGKMSIEDMWK